MQASRTPHIARRQFAATTTQRGVTLIEACAVMAIAAVMAGSALVSWQPMKNKRLFEAVVGEVPVEVNFARSAALTQPGGVWLSYHAVAGGTCALVHAGAKPDCSCNSDGQAVCTGKGQALKATLHPVPVAIAKPIHFNDVNGTVTPTATIRVQSASGQEVHHKVNLMGRVRSCSPRGAVTGYSAC